jgi:hypothetical protein
MLITSIYFGAWGKLTKSNKMSNKSVKFHYWREWKKLLVLKKQRNLGQMLMITNEKIGNINRCSEIFAEMNKQAYKI